MASPRSTRSRSVGAYRTELESVTRLSRTDELELALQFRRGDQRAGERLISACLPFVISIALEYRRWGAGLEDIIQQGNLGLLRATAKFDPTKQCRLATYASYWIRAEIRDYVVRSYRVVRLGTTKAERRALRAFRLARDCDAQQLAELSGISVERATCLLPVLASREASLDEPPAHGFEHRGLTDMKASPEEEAGDRESRVLARKSIDAALAQLSARERLIVEERMMRDDPLTLQRIGNILGVSKERVRQLEQAVRTKLRERLRDLREVA